MYSVDDYEIEIPKSDLTEIGVMVVIGIILAIAYPIMLQNSIPSYDCMVSIDNKVVFNDTCSNIATRTDGKMTTIIITDKNDKDTIYSSSGRIDYVQK